MSPRMAQKIAPILLSIFLVACGRTTDPPPDGPRADMSVGDRAGDMFMVEVASEQPPSADGRVCPMECIREVICCRGDCSGPVVSRGCCACLPGEVDSLYCPAERRCAP